jgi:hypothetical protein
LSTVVGLPTFGAGGAATQGLKAAARQGVKALIRAGTKKMAAQAATGAAEGAVYAGAQDAARQEAEIGAGREEEFDPMRTLKSAGTGAAVGGSLGAAVGGVRAIRGREKYDVLAQASDKVKKGADTAAMEAEHVLDLKASRDAPTNLRGHVTIRDANAIAKDYEDTAKLLVNRTKVSKSIREKIQEATLNSKATTDAELDDLAMSSPEGGALAQAIRKRKVADSVTARNENDDNIVKRGIRQGIDYMPVPPVLARTIQQILRAPTRTEHINSKVLSKKNIKIAEEVLKQTGDSTAKLGIDELRDLAARRSVVSRTSATNPVVSNGKLEININTPRGGIGGEPANPNPIRNYDQWRYGMGKIQGMQADVLKDAADLPQSSMLRGAMEDYVQSLDTWAKKDMKSRQEAYEAAVESLSPEDRAKFDAHPKIKALRQHFKEMMSADDVRKRGAARKNITNDEVY